MEQRFNMSSVIIVIGATQPSLQFSIDEIGTKHSFVIQRKRIQCVGFYLLQYTVTQRAVLIPSVEMFVMNNNFEK